MWLRRGVPAAVVCAAVLAGCGTSDKDLVQAKVHQFLEAAAHQQYATLCRQVLAPSLLAHLVDRGIPCATAMRIGLGGLKDPALSIGRTDVHGDRASVIAITTAQGQEASLDAIELVKTSAGWRVSSLGTPQIGR